MKRIKQFKILIILAVSTLLVGCSNDGEDGPSKSTLTLNILNLESLDNGFKYEGWVITPDGPVSTGKFTRITFPITFQVVSTVLEEATSFVLTIEPANDTDANPSNTKILQGDFIGNAASLVINNVIGDFTSASGSFIMASPTDTDATNDQNGLWFIDASGTTNVAGLNLPTLSASSGWKYEGWVLENGIPVSTGTFSSVSNGDDFSPFSGNQPAPSFPGEDFLNNTVAPAGVTFPLDVRGKQVVISIEPSPDDNTSPFYLKPLVGQAGTSTAPTANAMSLNRASFPLGTASR